VLLEDRAVLRVGEAKRAGEAHADGAHLAGDAAAGRGDLHVEVLGIAGHVQRSEEQVLQGDGREILIEGPVVHRDIAAAGAEEHAGDRGLASADGVEGSDAHIRREISRCWSVRVQRLDQLVSLGLLGLMGMVVASVHVELAKDRAAEAVVRDHAEDGLLKDALGMLLAHALGIGGLVAADVTGEGGIGLVRLFLARENGLLCVHDDDVITGVNVGGKDGLVLAAKEVRCVHSHTAHHLVSGINDPPLALHFLGLGRKGFHVLCRLLYRSRRLSKNGERDSRGFFWSVKQIVISLGVFPHILCLLSISPIYPTLMASNQLRGFPGLLLLAFGVAVLIVAVWKWL
jgi:hypothetical protein